jgi:hypothetical protein
MVGAVIGGVASGIGGLFGAGGSSAAASAQVQAANKAIDLQRQMFETTQNELAPFIQGGQNAFSAYAGGLNNLTLPSPLSNFQPAGGAAPPSFITQAPVNIMDGRLPAQTPFNASPYTTPNGIPTFDYNANPAPQAITGADAGIVNPTTTAATTPASFDYQNWGLGADQQAALAKTPGYQFTLDQGLRGVANQEAAKGRGVSGNELAGAATYATGLANNTFNQQFQNAMAGQGLSFGQTLQGQGQQYGQALSSNQQELAGQNQAFNQLAQSYGLQLGGRALAFNQPLTQQEQAWNQLTQGQAQGYGQSLQNVNQQLALNQQAFQQPLSLYNTLLQGGYQGLAGQQQGYAQQYQNELAPFSLTQPLINYGVQSGLGLGGLSNQAASNLTGLTTGAGAATAGGIVGSTNALTGAGTGIANAYMVNQLLNPSAKSNGSLANNVPYSMLLNNAQYTAA